MARREIIVEVLTPDEICWELYGTAKQGLLKELRHEQSSVRALSQDERERGHRRRPQPVPGPTHRAMLQPGCRRYIDKECT